MGSGSSFSAGLALLSLSLAALGCGGTDTALRVADAGARADVVTAPDTPAAPRDVVAPPEDVPEPPPADVPPPPPADVPPPPPYDAGPVDASTAVLGLPCDITRILTTWCTPCHSRPPRMEAPGPLLTRADLLGPSSGDATVDMAHASVTRMRDAMDPMPPAPTAMPADQIATFARWVTAGAPAGTCDPAADPLNASPRCTSNLVWFLGNSLGDAMNPGEACIACHAMRRRGPTYQIAGTVYPTGHENTNCIPPLNSAANVTIEITGADGRVTSIAANLVGNFHWSGTLALPYTARLVTRDGRERRMLMPQRNGDCNACHTAAGTMDAPGRITVPM